VGVGVCGGTGTGDEIGGSVDTGGPNRLVVGVRGGGLEWLDVRDGGLESSTIFGSGVVDDGVDGLGLFGRPKLVGMTNDVSVGLLSPFMVACLATTKSLDG
jgi:hypothetical protein